MTHPCKAPQTHKYRGDLLLCVALLLLAGILAGILFLCRKPGATVVVTQNDLTLLSVSLSEDGTYPIRTQAGYNLLVVENGSARIAEADCPHGICTQSGAVRYAGQTIVCLPHKLVVTVVGGDDAPADFTTGRTLP